MDQRPEKRLFRELCCVPGWLSCPAGGSGQLAQGRDLESRTGKPSSASLWPGPHRRAEQDKMETRGPAPCPQCKGLWRLVSEHHAEGASCLQEMKLLRGGGFPLNPRSEIDHWVKRNRPEAQSRRTNKIRVVSTSDPERRRCKAPLSSVIRAQSLADLGVSFSADEQRQPPASASSLASRPRSHRVKGCGSHEWLGALLLQAPDPNPVPGCRARLRRPGTHADTMEEQVSFYR